MYTRIVVLLLTVFLLAGCGNTRPSSFYLLSEIPHHHIHTKSYHPRSLIGIGPILIPKYLEQPQIVTRLSNNQLHLAEYNRWAESLGDNVTRVISDNIAFILGTNHIHAYPWKRTMDVNYQVKVNVRSFEADCYGHVVLRVRWYIIKDDDQKIVFSKTHSYSRNIEEKPPYDVIASCMSHILADLSRDIASSLYRKVH